MNDFNDFDDEPTTAVALTKPANIFAAPAKPASAVAGALEKREEAEVFAMVMMAKKFPRVQAESMDRILNAFARPTLAEVSQYQYARGGTSITGPSIRAAEAIAQEWGNLDTGWKELSRGIGEDGKPYSFVQAYCIDLQSTNRKSLTFIVPHWRDTKSGGYKLKDERDIYELCANQAQRRLRACILANIPGDVVEQAMNQAAVTLHASADTSPEAQKKLLEAFGHWGVTKEHIEAKIQRRLDSISAAQMVQMKRIYASLRDDMSKPGDWFDMPADAPKAEKVTTLGDLEKKAAAPAATPAPSPTPTPAADPNAATDLAGTPLGGPMLPHPDDLAKKLKAAKTLESLDVHLDWVRHYDDDAVKLRLNEIADVRRTELSK